MLFDHQIILVRLKNRKEYAVRCYGSLKKIALSPTTSIKIPRFLGSKSGVNFRNNKLTSPGYSLIELAIVLTIVGLVMVLGFSASSIAIETGKRSATKTSLDKIQLSLVAYASQQKRLPCPADGTLSVGTEISRNGNGDCSSQQYGVVPWAVLGLSEADILDGWNSRITYRIAQGLTRDNSLDMTYCDPAGTASATGSPPNQTCNTTCTSSTFPGSCTSPTNFLNGKGIEIRNASGTKLMDPSTGPPYIGAAYVLISPGKNLSGGMNSGGIVSAATGMQEGTQETQNRADANLQTYYVDNDIMESDSSSHFDDVLRRPSVVSVINGANLGPRAH